MRKKQIRDRKITNIYNVPDFKDISGNWVMYFSPEIDVCLHTRSAVLWNNLTQRCSGKIKGYEGSENFFESYQQFTSWCQNQYGYMLKEENGKYWQLDKDILDPGEQVYSPNTCLFIPTKLNSFIRERVKSGLIGTSLIKGRYKAQIRSSGGRNKILGVFDTEIEAHLAWREGKAKRIEEILSTEEFIEHEDLVNGLLIYKDYLRSFTNVPE